MYSSISDSGSRNYPVLGRSGAFVLTADETEAILKFFRKQPAHCAYSTSLIHEHGLMSQINRGTLYGSKNFLGELRGVALIGHATIIEPTNKESLKDLAATADTCNSRDLVMCEERWAEQYWKHHGTDRSIRCGVASSCWNFVGLQGIQIEIDNNSGSLPAKTSNYLYPHTRVWRATKVESIRVMWRTKGSLNGAGNA